MELEETTGGYTLIIRIGVYRTSIREPRSSDLFCTDVRGQHGSSPAIRYYSILVKNQTRLYETPFSAELVASNKIIVSHVNTTDQLAYIFTKFLDYPKFKATLDKIINFAS